MIRIYKFAYNRWYDNHYEGGNALAARFWGFIADQAARFC